MSQVESLPPGGYLLDDDAGDIHANVRRQTAQLTVANTGDRPIQIGSHYHFFEVNAALTFDRAEAYGRRLNIPAGTAVRFEPGETKTVEVVDLAGARVMHGHRGLVNGALDDPTIRDAALKRVGVTSDSTATPESEAQP